MKKAIAIGHVPQLQFKSYVIIFIGMFATVWTFIEPLGFFGVFPEITTRLGLIGYALLVLIALICSIVSSKILRLFKVRNQESIEFLFESSSDGQDHLLKCPKNTQVFDLTNLIIEHLERGKAREKVKSLRFNYDPVLFLKRDRQEIELDQSGIISEINLKKTDRLFIKAIPRQVGIRFSIASK